MWYLLPNDSFLQSRYSESINVFTYIGFALQHSKRLRVEEEALHTNRGDLFGYQTFRLKYRDSEQTEFPYPRLQAFIENRTIRDMYIGERVDMIMPLKP